MSRPLKRRLVRPHSNHTGWVVIDDGIYNGRGWLHSTVEPVSDPRIWHWHGYKPSDVQCWLHAIRAGTWPVRAWRELEGCHRGRCKYQPIRNSGCRSFPQIKPARCYLRTYAHLLGEHQRLLWLSHNVFT